jgi:hypothetical protein
MSLAAAAGAVPSREQELHRVLAAAALGLAAEDATDVHAAPDAQPYEWVARWEREQPGPPTTSPPT